MVKIYYHDNIDSDQRLPHEGEPATVSAVEELGLFVANIQDRAEVDRIAKEKGYNNRDEVWTSRKVIVLNLCSSRYHRQLLEKNTRQLSKVFTRNISISMKKSGIL